MRIGSGLALVRRIRSAIEIDTDTDRLFMDQGRMRVWFGSFSNSISLKFINNN